MERFVLTEAQEDMAAAAVKVMARMNVVWRSMTEDYKHLELAGEGGERSA